MNANDPPTRVSALQRIRPILDLVATLTMTAAALTVMGVALFSSGGRAGGGAPRKPPVEAVTGLTLTIAPEQVVNKGARTVLVEYTDYECPFCARYAIDTYPEIRRRFVDTGDVEYVTRNFPLERLHPSAFKASEAAECARDQGRYAPMRDVLFAHQRTLAQVDFAQQARTLGLDVAQYGGCLNGRMRARIEAEQADGNRLGITTTPTFLVGRIRADGHVTLVTRVTGAQPYDTFKSVIEAAMRAN